MTDPEIKEEPQVIDIESQEVEEELPEPDYKFLWEEEKTKVERTAEKYREVERERNVYRDRSGKLIRAITDNGLGEFDDSLNVTLKVPVIAQKEPEIPQTQKIQKKIEDLKGDYKAGRVEADDYFEKLSELTADLKTKQLRQEWEEDLKVKAEETKKAKTEEQKQTAYQQQQTQYVEILNRDYKAHNDTESPLFVEMSRIFSEDGAQVWGDPSRDHADRLRLAKLAAANLGLKRPEQKPPEQKPQERKGNAMHSFDAPSGAPPPPSKGKLSEQHKSLLVRTGIKDQKMLDGLKEAVGHITGLPSDHTYFQGGRLSVHLDAL